MDSQTAVDAAITSRRSVRAFLDKPVPRDTVEDILRVASRAPSGTNTQPWKVVICTGATLDAVKEAAVAAFSDGSFGPEETYKYYPDRFVEPYLSRRRKVGLDLYGLLGIAKGEGDKMFAQHKRNYLFFDALVGLFFVIDKNLEIGSWLDHGMFMQNVMIAARGRGLDTCPQAAWAPYHKAVRDIIGLEENEVLVAGMALGYADESAVENGLQTERADLCDFTSFLD
ncbi:MAG: nitroreductase [Ahrensia sp.]|nr:nitroreductase [Ahrensia sp.]